MNGCEEISRENGLKSNGWTWFDRRHLGLGIARCSYENSHWHCLPGAGENVFCESFDQQGKHKYI